MKKIVKKWVEPQLLILTRNNPEEVVLNCCKHKGSSNTPYTSNSGCYHHKSKTDSTCVECQTSANS